MKVILSLLFLLFIGCTEPRFKRYQDIIDPKVGVADKTDMNRMLGSPVKCTPDGSYQMCEYRTAKGRNEPVPSVHEKKEGFPDLSPYEYYDVLHLFYDDFGVLRDWKPVVLPKP